jgi:Mn2+/Fe2+ NRAMP family transporter
LTQVAAVFVLPLVIACIMYLVNQKTLMGSQKAGLWLNFGLSAAFVFACIISYTGALALIELL